MSTRAVNFVLMGFGNVGLHALAGTEISAIERVLNGTTNFILGKMEQGTGYSEALKEAQTQGIAELDPTLDVEGWDTAVKLFLIANSVMGTHLALEDVKVEGITNIPPKLLEAAKKEGKTLKLLGEIKGAKDHFRAQVRVAALDRTHPLFGVVGRNKGITFFTDSMGPVSVIGGKSDPRGAAAALLKDIINIYR